MQIKKLKLVRFSPKGENSFYDAVVANVNAYFKQNSISPFANTAMWIKTAAMLSLYFVPYLFLVTGFAANSYWLFFGLWFLMGIGISGIGTAVMHDANHGTYSSNKKINNVISHALEIIGGYTVTWRIQHNVLHHTYTNVAGLDEDIGSTKLLRLSPRQPLYWFHRYQYVYAWLLYMFMTLFWTTVKDYFQVVRYKKHNLLIKEKVTLKQALFRMTLYKLFYYTYVLVLPMMFSGQAWYVIVAGFLLMHFTAGILLSCVFQPSHVIEESAFAAPLQINGRQYMEDTWAIHEVVNTTDFAPNNQVLSWFVGGLNYQIEHHLFTNVCHIHYRKIAPIVQLTAVQYGLPYHVQPTFSRALYKHALMLKKLGRV